MSKPIWEKKNPKKKSKKLTPAQLRWAKEYSRRKGWKYPNAVANIKASQR